jgi:hypothetical protein
MQRYAETLAGFVSGPNPIAKFTMLAGIKPPEGTPYQSSSVRRWVKTPLAAMIADGPVDPFTVKCP